MNKKRCTNCGRFPFCEYQDKCTKNGEEWRIEAPLNNRYQKIYTDYWIKREVILHNVKNKSL